MHGLRDVLASWVRRRCTAGRTAAALIAGVAVLLVVELLTERQVEAYDVALVGTVALGAVATATWLWHRSCFEARVAAVVLATLVLVGQLLVSTVGVPGGPASSWTPTGIAVALLALAIPALVTADARRPWPVESAEPPYAL